MLPLAVVVEEEDLPIQIVLELMVVLVVVVLLMETLVELVVVFYSQDLLRLIHLLLVGVVMVLIMAVDQDLLVEAVEPYRMEYSILLLVVKVVMECSYHQISAIQLQV